MTDKESDAPRREVVSGAVCSRIWAVNVTLYCKISEGGSGRGRKITGREGQRERKRKADRKQRDAESQSPRCGEAGMRWRHKNHHNDEAERRKTQ